MFPPMRDRDGFTGTGNPEGSFGDGNSAVIFNRLLNAWEGGQSLSDRFQGSWITQVPNL